MARRQKNMGIAELVLMGANPKRSRNRAEHDARWAVARDILKNGAGARNAKALKRITNAGGERKLFGGLAQNGKKEFRAKRSAWKDALAEGRVVRFDGGDSFRSYPTREQAQAAFEKFRADGLHVDLPAPQHNPTIYESLKQRLGREPSNAELKAEVSRIKEEGYVSAATKGKLPHQRRRNAGDRIDWNQEIVGRLEESYRGLRKAGWSHADALRETLSRTTAGRGAIAEFKRRIKNPDATDKAAELFEDFHGKAASEVIELQEADTIRKTYTALGDLVDLTIETPDGKGACIEFKGDGVKVASAPGGKQLYLIGGTQTLDDQLGQFGTDVSKDFVELGRAVQITYRARKSMNDFRLVDYYHDLGEESGNPPLAFYDRIRKRIYFTGGSYHVEAPGIID